MTTLRLSLRVAACGLVAALCAATADAQDAKPAPKPVARAKTAIPGPQFALEPRAVEILKATSARLAAARSLSFTAVVSYENPSRFGPPLVYTTRSEVLLQRPDKLRVITPGDGPASEFYVDGRTMAAFAPAENLLAVADAPPTIDAALKKAFDTAAIYFPFTDLIVADPWNALAGGLRAAFYIGQSTVVGGTLTDIVAYVTDDVFVQIWIGAEDKLPRAARAVYRRDRAQLRQELVLSDWKLDVAVPADAFATAGAAKAARIPFDHPNRRITPTAKPAARPAAKGQ